MPNFAGNHEQNRVKICACCGVKKKKVFPVTEALERLIKAYVFSKYSKEEIGFPAGVCATCRPLLFQCQKGNEIPMESRKKWESIDWDQLSVAGARLSNGDGEANCDCFLCQVARHNIKKWLPGTSGDQVVPTIYGLDTVTSEVEEFYPPKLCPDCTAVIGRGIPHNCHSKKARAMTLADRIRQEDPKTQEKVSLFTKTQRYTVNAKPNLFLNKMIFQHVPRINIKYLTRDFIITLSQHIWTFLVSLFTGVNIYFFG